MSLVDFENESIDPAQHLPPTLCPSSITLLAPMLILARNFARTFPIVKKKKKRNEKRRMKKKKISLITICNMRKRNDLEMEMLYYKKEVKGCSMSSIFIASSDNPTDNLA